MLPSSGQKVPEALLASLCEHWKLRERKKTRKADISSWAFPFILRHFFDCSNFVKYSPERKLASHTICPTCVKYLQKAGSSGDTKPPLIFLLPMLLSFLYTCFVLPFTPGPCGSNLLSSAGLTGNCHA